MRANYKAEPSLLKNLYEANVALKISEKIKRPVSVKSELQLLTKGGRRIDSDAELHGLEDDFDV